MAKQGERGRRSDIGEDHPVGRIEDDHRALRGRLDALMGIANRKGILSSLQELPKMLMEHFEAEEAVGGLYEDLARRSPPHISNELDVLRSEHRVILDEFEALRRAAESHPEPDGAISETTMGEMARWVERMLRHERAEAKMIADVYYIEEGGRG